MLRSLLVAALVGAAHGTSETLDALRKEVDALRREQEHDRRLLFAVSAENRVLTDQVQTLSRRLATSSSSADGQESSKQRLTRRSLASVDDESGSLWLRGTQGTIYLGPVKETACRLSSDGSSISSTCPISQTSGGTGSSNSGGTDPSSPTSPAPSSPSPSGSSSSSSTAATDAAQAAIDAGGAAAGYFLATSGTCASAGYQDIDSKDACTAAIAALGLGSYTTPADSVYDANNEQPHGCEVWEYTFQNELKVNAYYQSLATGVVCGGTYPFLVSTSGTSRCICTDGSSHSAPSPPAGSGTAAGEGPGFTGAQQAISSGGAAASYRLVTSGTCAGAGYQPISTTSECTTAITALGIGAHTLPVNYVYEQSDQTRPSGCEAWEYVAPGSTDSQAQAKLNPLTTNIECGATAPFLDSMSGTALCICKAGAATGDSIVDPMHYILYSGISVASSETSWAVGGVVLKSDGAQVAMDSCTASSSYSTSPDNVHGCDNAVGATDTSSVWVANWDTDSPPFWLSWVSPALVDTFQIYQKGSAFKTALLRRGNSFAEAQGAPPCILTLNDGVTNTWVTIGNLATLCGW